ncbi:uncharacterized protein LOC112535352 [Ricinus communis]|uniref:uncharacterized protein LOC112535352 n=1 Tax=Ricinus communis TaxID=3988 RepID=UPI00201A517B|nr:uncharacterized protein LOC112535352 [Ricinus communis]
MVIANEMCSYGENMEDIKIVEKILRSLTEKWNYVVCSIEESKDTSNLSVDALQSSLLVHEQKFKKEKDVDSDEQALQATYEDKLSGRGRGRHAFRGRGHGRSRGSHYMEHIKCYKCHKRGHFQSECPEWKLETHYAEEEEELLLIATTEAPGKSFASPVIHSKYKQAATSRSSIPTKEHMAFMSFNQTNRKEDTWFLDSGCSNHMSGDSKWFSKLDTMFNTSVKLGNDTRMKVTGKGNIHVRLNGKSHIICDVYYIPELGNNLLSLG